MELGRERLAVSWGHQLLGLCTLHGPVLREEEGIGGGGRVWRQPPQSWCLLTLPGHHDGAAGGADHGGEAAVTRADTRDGQGYSRPYDC